VDLTVAICLARGNTFKIASTSSTPTRLLVRKELQNHFEYADKLKGAVLAALEEDAILVAVMKTYHAE